MYVYRNGLGDDLPEVSGSMSQNVFKGRKCRVERLQGVEIGAVAILILPTSILSLASRISKMAHE